MISGSKNTKQEIFLRSFFFFFFFCGEGMSEGPISLFFLWFFLTLLSFKINLSIHITFTLSKYDSKRNLMFYQNISVKHRLSFLCFGNVRVDVDDGFFCLGIAVWWFPFKFSHWTQEYQRVCSTILETCYRLDMCFCVLFFRDYRIVLIEQVTEMNDGNRNSHRRMFCSLVII